MSVLSSSLLLVPSTRVEEEGYLDSHSLQPDGHSTQGSAFMMSSGPLAMAKSTTRSPFAFACSSTKSGRQTTRPSLA